MAARSHPGLVRLNNEDAVFTNAELGVAILADGMGGLFAGEEASAVAVEAVRRQLLDEQVAITSVAVAEQVLRNAHEVLLEYAATLNFVGKMGTTLIFWMAAGEKSYFAHIGDSRLYRLAEHSLVQQSHDHTLAQRMIDTGVLRPSRGRLSPKRHVLTQGLGLPGMINPQAEELQGTGRLLMCSDGLSDRVPEARLAQALRIDSIEAAATELVRLALDEGGHDNVSLVVIDP